MLPQGLRIGLLSRVIRELEKRILDTPSSQPFIPNPPDAPIAPGAPVARDAPLAPSATVESSVAKLIIRSYTRCSTPYSLPGGGFLWGKLFFGLNFLQ